MNKNNNVNVPINDNKNELIHETKNMVHKSVSTLQLLGALNTLPISESKEISSDPNQGLTIPKDDLEVLISVSRAVLSNVQILRRIIRQYPYGRIGRELQQISLTVASFERILYTFIKEEFFINNDDSGTTDGNPSLNSKLSSNIKFDFRRSSALKDILPLIPKNKNHPILTGGIATLLNHATYALEDMNKILNDLQNNFDPQRETRRSFIKFSFVSILFIIYKLKMYIKSNHFIRKKIDLFHLQHGKKMNLSFGIKYSFLLFILMDMYGRFKYHFSNLRKIKISHGKILLTLRLFLLCQHVLHRARQNKFGSQRLLIDSPVEADINDDLKNATALLVERVPLPADYYNNLKEGANGEIGFIIFKVCSSVFMASSGFVYTLIGRNKYLWENIGSLLMIIIMPYYAIRFHKATRYTTRLLIDNPNVQIIRKAWSLFGESWLMKYLFLHRSPKIPLREKIYVDIKGENASISKKNKNDIPIYMFSARDIQSIKNAAWNIPETSKYNIKLSEDHRKNGLPMMRNIKYYKGGGFFARFFAQDTYNLSKWALKLGVLIVYIDYDLAPETQYPESLRQCHSVYKWLVSGGLGFYPDKIVAFGESAGGNIAAALTILINQEKQRKLNGLVLVHPALNMHLSPSPSRFLHQSDPILPRGILELALNSYYPLHGGADQYLENRHDPLVSPGSASNEILSKFPITSLLVGGLDPLLDDSVDFNTKLRYVNIPGTLRIFQGLSHGFLICGDLSHEAQKAIDITCETIQNIFRQK